MCVCIKRNPEIYKNIQHKIKEIFLTPNTSSLVILSLAFITLT